MVERIQLLRNIGQFDSVSAGAQIALTKLTLLYAENGRGKTTLAAILRSLGTGDAQLISERHRLAAANPPHVVLQVAGSSIVFQNGAWSTTLPRLAIFDDTFVAQNVCSGIEVETEHRQNLHELILGAQGVTLNATLQGHIVKIEEHIRSAKAKSDAIPATARGKLTADAFCALEATENIGTLVTEAEQNLNAAKSADAVRKETGFATIELPAFDVDDINALLARGLPALEAEAAARVQAHLATLGSGGEQWVGEGMNRIDSASSGKDHEICPFCAQDLRSSPVIEHYRAYFSEGYAALKSAIADKLSSVEAAHSGDVPAAFERAVSTALRRREFWRSFANVPEIEIDTAAISRAWKAVRDSIIGALKAKQAAPLDETAVSAEALISLGLYNALREGVQTLSGDLQASNHQIEIVKEQAAAANVDTLNADLVRLKAVQSRHTPEIAALCDAYLAEKGAKTATETLRDQARATLDQHRQTVFPAYEVAINAYLQKFNAGFRLGSVNSVNSRTGSSCSYNVVINNVPVAINAGTNGGPAFRNTLSAGDRNTLALAFFFASLDQDPQLAQKIVVIDDPMTSLDEHRSLTTVQEMRRLAARVEQLLVLSHSKAFLCAVWNSADTATRSAVKIVRDGAGSSLSAWDVHQDCITEHDKRHARLPPISNPATRLRKGTWRPHYALSWKRLCVWHIRKIIRPEHC